MYVVMHATEVHVFEHFTEVSVLMYTPMCMYEMTKCTIPRLLCLKGLCTNTILEYYMHCFLNYTVDHNE